MFGAILILVLALHSCQGDHRNWDNATYGTEWVVFLDDKGKPHFVNLSIPDKEIKLQGYFHPISASVKPKFWLHTRNTNNRTEELFTPTQNSSHYIAEAPLVVLVHGWLSNRDSDSTQLIKNAILIDSKKNYNVVIMDWSSMQSWNYIYSAKQTLPAADKLKEFIQSLANLYNMDGSKIHLIGHSLGAHVVGLAGAKLKGSNLIISRVTGLDPARPFFELPNVFSGISKESAAFVDIIHTSGGTLGIFEPAGHADFYPGGGIMQPALCPSLILPGPCEHSSAYIYFQMSLTKKFQARQCHDYFMYTTGLCNTNPLEYMGEPCKHSANGSFFLDVKSM